MKIHDKFVIELREVIKGYGNDPTVQDPCKFPCDYKFYEIEGVAICEKSFKKMKRLEDEVNVVFDKIRAEIEQIELLARYTRGDIKQMALDIIDKYRGEKNETDN